MRRPPLPYLRTRQLGPFEDSLDRQFRALRRKFSSSGGFEKPQLDTPRKPLNRLSQEEEVQNDPGSRDNPIRRSAYRQHALEEMGTLPERAAMGNST